MGVEGRPVHRLIACAARPCGMPAAVTYKFCEPLTCGGFAATLKAISAVEGIFTESLAEDLPPDDPNYRIVEGILRPTAFDMAKLQAPARDHRRVGDQAARRHRPEPQHGSFDYWLIVVTMWSSPRPCVSRGTALPADKTTASPQRSGHT